MKESDKLEKKSAAKATADATADGSGSNGIRSRSREASDEFDIIEHVVRPRLSNPMDTATCSANCNDSRLKAEHQKLTADQTKNPTATCTSSKRPADWTQEEAYLDIYGTGNASASGSGGSQPTDGVVRSLVLDTDEIAKMVEARQFIQPKNVGQDLLHVHAVTEGLSVPRPSLTRGPNVAPAMIRPGAYLEAPGTNLQRTRNARYSLLGVAASPHTTEGNAMAEEHQQNQVPSASMEAQQRDQHRDDTQEASAMEPDSLPNPNPDESSNDISASENPEGLAVAAMVSEDEETEPPCLPQAAEFDMDSSLRQKEESMKQFKTKILLAVIVFTTFMILLLAILIPRKVNTNTGNTESPRLAAPSSMPSQMPTSMNAYLMSLLPNHTMIMISEEADSPQSKAWHWLLKDREFLPSSSEDQIKQRYALVTLYYATRGDLWTDKNGWLHHDMDECKWYNKPDFGAKFLVSSIYNGYLTGFLEPMPDSHCGPDGLYQHLWLDGNNLVWTLPEELFLLSNLKTFSSAFNTLHGTISTLIGQLTALEGLVSSDMKDTRAIPSEIGFLTNLQVLSCRNCDLQGTMPLEFWKLTNLSHFGLEVNPELQGSIPTEVGKIEKLRWLVMDRCDLSGTLPKELGQLQHLEMMIVALNQMSGKLPTEIGLLKKILHFSVRNNKFHGTLPTELGKLTTSTLLSLWGNQLSGAVPSEYGLLTNLTISLNLKNNFFGGTIPTQLGLLSRLHELEFQGNQFTGPIPSEFGQLSSIGHLTFANNSLVGLFPQELASLQPSLHTLTLDGNPRLSGTIPEAVCNMNGSCISISWDQCNPVHGLFFDCSNLLCGCDCPCAAASRMGNKNQN
ncbi:Leucine Rich Repeat [Seminavis robusta]|uniref:Leucine Rich Repeat n=1 Tax=Seminavis robusta TaxID=568900 RepID=A0A9N8E1J5_9STRA|nr:Leucine Rich Repeat [Seminavis robusta]|eukprot:Sro558_g166310.1 Leucine Rich Repeat (849) ;mRNA; r:32337-34962